MKIIFVGIAFSAIVIGLTLYITSNRSNNTIIPSISPDAKTTSNRSNTVDVAPVVIPPITRSQPANFEEATVEAPEQEKNSARPYAAEHSASNDADWTGMDDSNPYQNWEPPSNHYFIDSPEEDADAMGESSNSYIYENWTPQERVYSGFADEEYGY